MPEPSPSVPRVGDPAPGVSLPSTAGRDVALADYRGRSNVVLAFFPLGFTGVCRSELCSFSEDLSAFEGLDATVLGISVDSVPTLNESRRKEGITVDLLSDFKRVVCRRYGTLDEELVSSRRAYVVVDRAGIVRWTRVERDLGHRRENGEPLEVLRTL